MFSNGIASARKTRCTRAHKRTPGQNDIYIITPGNSIHQGYTHTHTRTQAHHIPYKYIGFWKCQKVLFIFAHTRLTQCKLKPMVCVRDQARHIHGQPSASVCVVCARVRTLAFMCANEIPDIRNNQLCNQCSRDRTTCCDSRSVSRCRHFLHRLQVAAQVLSAPIPWERAGRHTHTHTQRVTTRLRIVARRRRRRSAPGGCRITESQPSMLKRDNKNTWWRVFAYVLCVRFIFDSNNERVCVCLLPRAFPQADSSPSYQMLSSRVVVVASQPRSARSAR